MKLWQKKYNLNKKIEDYTVGNDFQIDHVILAYDCKASIAHAEMLNQINILTEDELQSLVNELNNIIALSNKGEFIIEKSDEDCHTAIEKHLTKKLGDTGKKIHTARSRNDQVLTALRLYYLDNLKLIKTKIIDLQKTLEIVSNENKGIEFPGYTHTRKAMVTSVDMWIGALKDSMDDNLLQLEALYKLLSQSPLGTAAGYGVPITINRDYTAQKMGFAKVQKNPIYAQHSRGKFEATLLSFLSLLMFDGNKYASDLILLSMPEFGFFNLPDEFLTGSSIMPQKKNPDVLELLRANYHVVTSAEFQIKSMMSNLISGYHRDFQFFKEPVVKSIEIVQNSLDIMILVFSNLKFDKEKCKEAITEEVLATEKVYKLVEQGMTFRDAYKKIAEGY